ncbi:MAG: hypothetical protein NTY09_12650 [bacterium]|nr:hypothetical protein [bacterium]
MLRYIKFSIIFMIITIAVMFLYTTNSKAFNSGSGVSYSYGQSGLLDVLLTDNESKIYISQYMDDCIIEINTSTMLEIRRVEIIYPSIIEFSPAENYIYAISYGNPSSLVRIHLPSFTYNPNNDVIELDGGVNDLTISPDGSRCWIVHSTWPLNGDSFTDFNLDAPPDTGILTEIDLSNYSISSSISIPSVPSSVYYSPTAEKLFVQHQKYYREYDPNATGRAQSIPLIEGDIITIYDVENIGRPVKEFQELVGGRHESNILNIFALNNWDDSGSNMIIPNVIPRSPEFSARVVDTNNYSTFDLIFEDANTDAMGAKYFHKVPGQNILWVAIEYGFPVAVEGPHENFLIRVNTIEPYNHEIFICEEAIEPFGDFEVSNDGETLYLTVPNTGEIIVWSPD